MSERLTDVTVQLLHETERAYLITDDGEREVCVPKSMCEMHKLKDDTYEMTLPEWKAKQEGLI